MNKKVKTKISTLFMLVVLLAQTLTPAVTVFAEDTTMSTQTSSEVQSINESTSQVEVGQGETTTSNTIPVVPNTTPPSTTPPSTTVSSEVSASTEVSSESPTSESQEVAATEESTEEDEEPAQSSTEVSETTTESTEISETTSTESKKEGRREPGRIPGNIIKDFKLTDINGIPSSPDKPLDPNSPEGVKVTFDWELPENHGVAEGDFFEFKLTEPSIFNIKGSLKGDLKGSDGTIFGTYTIDTDGNVKLVFNENVSLDEVSGDVEVYTYLDIEKIKTSTTQEIKTPISSPDNTTNIYLKPSGGSPITKKGTMGTFKAEKVEWAIDINTSLEELINSEISDVIPSGLTLKPDSIKIEILSVDLEGSATGTGEFLKINDGFEFSEPFNVKLLLQGDEKYKAYRIHYETTVDNYELLENKHEWENNATLTNDGKPTNVKDTVSSNYGKELSKGDPKYSPETQTFDWRIEYNFGQKEINVSEALIEDKWTLSPEGSMSLQELKIYPVELDSKGQISSIQKDKELEKGIDYTLIESGNGFEVKFLKDITTPYVIDYQTKVDSIVSNEGEVTNTVTSNGENSTGSSGTFTQQGVIKTPIGHDVNEKTISWKIEVNKNKYYMENLVLKDTFNSDGLKFIDGSLEIKDGEKTLKSGIDYDFSYDAQGFEIHFKGAYSTTSQSFVVTYDTNFERNSNSRPEYGNAADINWEDNNGKPHTSNTGNITTKPEGYTGQNGKKTGKYDPENRKIEWTIFSNYARLDISGKVYTITDKLDESLDYVEDSLKAFTYTIDKNGLTTVGETLTLNTDYTFSVVDGELIVIFTEAAKSKKTLGIKFETIFKKDVVDKAEINNTAIVNAGEKEDRLPEKVTIPNGNKFANKEGYQEGNTIQWSIELNPNGSTITDYKLTDTVAEIDKDNPENTVINSILISDSFKVYEASIGENGLLSKGNLIESKGLYEIKDTSDSVTGRQSFELSFTKTINQPYIVEYQTLIDLTGRGTISNSYIVSGNGTEIVTKEEESSVPVQMSGSSGTGKGKVGSLKIVKQDEQGLPITNDQAIAATFELWDSKGEVRYRKPTALGPDGTLIFRNVRAGTYKLVEKTPPDGYAIASEYAGKGKTITVEISETESMYKFEVKDPKYKIELIKNYDSNANQPLSPAEFSLYEKDAANPVEGYKDMEIVDGRLLKEIDPEDIISRRISSDKEYIIKETKAASGYLLNTQASDPFKLVLNNDGTQTIPKIAITNYQGSVKWKKTDNSESPIGLEGAKFEALIKNDQDVFEPTGKIGTSNKNGEVVIGGLKPGVYKLTEIEAPTDYIKNPTLSSEFTIDATANGKPEIKDLTKSAIPELKNYQGRAKMKKTDKEDKPLSNAEFVIKKKDSNHFYNGVNANGKINWITNQTNVAQENKFISNADGVVVGPLLGLGSYQFVEVKAPVGYIINTSGIDFEITATDNQTDNELGIVDKTANPLVNYKGSVELTKRGHNNVELPDVLFRLLDSSKKVVTGKENLKTDSTGKIKVEELSPGVYYFEEKSAADDSYVLNPKLLEFEIPTASDGIPDVIKIEFQNYRGSAKLTKTLNNEPAGTSVGRTARFYFRNSNNEYYQGIDDVSGAAIFNITPKILDVVITGNQGTKTVEGLAPGKYYWEEVKAPDGYLLNTSKKEVEIKASYTGEPAAESVSMTNYQGSAELSKINESGKGIDLINSGVEFKVYKKDDAGDLTEIAANQITYTATGKVQVSNLAPGKYTIEEVAAPKNYVRNPTSIDFEIPNQASEIPTVITEGLTLINYQGSAEFEKQDSKGNAIDLKDTGAEFKVYQVQSDGMLGKEPQGLVTINGNKVKVTGLGSGKYQFVEVTAPVGYIINTNGPTFTIEDETNKELSLKTGMKLINYQGSAQLVKKSGEKLIAGAEFKVVDGNNKDVQSKLISNAQGIVTVEGLAPGEYTFVETKPAPGYVLDAQPKAFTIANSYQGEPAIVSSGELTNSLTSFTFTKQVEAKQGLNNQPLANVVFAIKNSDGKYYNGTLNQPSESWVDHVEQISDAVKTSLTSDTEGKVSVNGLTPGTYIVEEIDVPTGIVKQEGTLLTITVDEMGTVSFEDSNSTIVNARQTIASISGEKIWGDSNNVFNTRPKSIELTLYRQIGENGVPEKVPGIDPLRVTGSNDEKWSYTFTNLVTHNDNREEYIFTVKETPIKGYTASYDGMNVTNTLNLISVSGKKTWIGDKNVEELSRPESITLILQRNGEDATDKDGKVITKVVTGPNWEYTFIDLPEFEQAGTEYTYSVKELSVPGYIAKQSGMNVTNTFQPMTITGQKIWQGDENIKDLTRPDKITVQLFRKGQTKPIAIQDISGPNWKYSFEGLPEFDGKNAYIYTVKEVDHNGYAATTSKDNKTITNTLNTTSVPVQKIWDDSSDPTTRPKTVTVELLRHVKGEKRIDVIDEATLGIRETTNVWEHEFKGLPTHNKDGKLFIYSIRETNVPDGYNATQMLGEDGKTQIITNTLIPEDEIFVKKLWDDATDTSVRPDEIGVQLYRQVGDRTPEKVGEVSKISSKNKVNEFEWQISFKGLASHDSSGKKYTYFVKEVTQPGSYTATADKDDPKQVINTLEETTVKVEKLWEDLTDISSRPDKVTVDLYRKSEGEDTYNPIDGEAFRSLELAALNKWTNEFTGLALKDKNGNNFTYTVKEREVPGYRTNITGSQVEGFKITNTLELTDVHVTKNWDDFSNKFELRPDDIHLQLMKRVGEELIPVEKQTIDANGEVKTTKVEMTLSDTVKDKNQISGTFSELTKYDENGTEIQYVVTETPVKGYETTVENIQTEVDGEQSVIVTNTLETTKVHITKNWSDFDDKFNLRPKTIQIDLFQGNKQLTPELVPVAEMNEEGNWVYTFDDLPKYDTTGKELKEYTYTIKEQPVTGYNSAIVSLPNETEGESNYQITNTLETINIPVTKVWKDTFKGKENYYQSRPESITIRLKQNGKEVSQVPAVKVVDKDGNWSHVFKDLPKLDKDGNSYKYEVTEDVVDKYNTKIDVNELNEVTITNTRKTYAIGDYTWIDTDKDGVQDPDEKPLVGVIVELFDEKGNPILDKDGKPMTTTTDDNGRYIFDELEDGKYTIKFTLTKEQSEMYEFTKQDAGENDKSDSDADELTGWTTTITLNDDSKELTKDYEIQDFKATEGIDPTWDAGVILREKIEVTGTKVWVGGPKVKPTIELQLYRNGKAFGKPVELKDGTTTYTWKNLYKTDTNKKPYVYTVKEVGTPSEYNKTEEGLEVTNTRKTYAIGDYTWIDEDKDGIQDKNEPVLPGVKVELFDENGKKIAETTTDKNGRYIFDELESGKYKVKFTLTDEQKKLYKFTKRHSGDASKDSNADDEGWTIDIDLNEKNAALTKDYQDQAFKASEGIDPTWDAGVILLDIPVKPTNPTDPKDPKPTKPDTTKPNLPQMGEAGNPFLLTSLGILLIGSVAGVVTARRRRQG